MQERKVFKLFKHSKIDFKNFKKCVGFGEVLTKTRVNIQRVVLSSIVLVKFRKQTKMPFFVDCQVKTAF